MKRLFAALVIAVSLGPTGCADPTDCLVTGCPPAAFCAVDGYCYGGGGCVYHSDCGPGGYCAADGFCYAVPECVDDFDCPAGTSCGADGFCYY